VREQTAAAGMDDFLAKPFEAEALHALLRRWLSDGVAAAPAKAAKAGDAGEAPIFDKERLVQLELRMPADSLAEFLDLWLSSTAERLANVARLAESGNLDEMSREAHDLVSTAGAIGADRLAALARALDGVCRAGQAEAAAALAHELGTIAAPTLDAVRLHLRRTG
jgi:HPt (histidine-containing phosphotransfer) domain-containing protein